jgi:hypothetical protein
VEKRIINTTSGNWPVTRKLTLTAILSLIIAALAAYAALAALLNPAQFYPSDLLGSFVPTDIATLAISLPVLLGSLWLAQRRKLIGLLCWPGALFSILFTFIPYLIAVPFNLLWVAYLLIVSLSASTMIALVASFDGDAVRTQLEGVVLAKTSGGILTGLGILIIVRLAALLVVALTNPTGPIAIIDQAVWVADAVISPALLVTGIQLWQRKPYGYTTGGSLLLAYGALSLGLIPYLLIQPQLDIAGVIIILIMAAMCLVPFSFFVRGAAAQGK